MRIALTRTSLGMLAMLTMLTSCGGLGTLNKDLDTISRLGGIRGNVEARDWDGAPLVVVALRVDDEEGLPDRVIDIEQRFEPGPYDFVLEPGQYRIGAFEDRNSNLRWDEGERTGAYNGFSPIELQEGSDIRRVDLTVSNRRVDPPAAVDSDQYEELRILGRVTPIDDERFSPEAGRMGLWNPVRFLAEIGAGIHFLSEYDEDKIPVLFVHGLGGYPQEFRALIDALDTTRFQAWVYHYPSSLSLDVLATYLNRDLNDLATTRGLSRFCLVGHSMGGVLSRLVIDRHVNNRARGLEIPLLVTIAAPLGGLPSAGIGARMSPIVLPSWRDLDPADDTILNLYEEALPSYSRFVLLYTHAPEAQGTDGVVSLTSQLRPEALAEARETWGYVASHTAALRDPAVAQRLSEVLETCAPLP